MNDMHRMVPTIALGLLLLSPCLPQNVANAQEWAPTRPLRFIISFSPGGTSDLVARTIAPGMGEGLGQVLVLDNRAGASGIVAAETIARAQPDGYTFGIASLSAHAGNATLAAKLPYDPIKDFQPLTFIGRSSLVLIVSPSNPARSVQELIAQAKAKPVVLKFASSGVGVANHIAGELLKIQSRTDMIHVPYKGGGEMMTAVMGGHVDMAFNPVSTIMAQVQGGKLRPLAVAGTERAAKFPNVPTLAEAGFPNVDVIESWGLLAPAGLPPAVTRRLRAEAIRALQRPDVAERLSTVGVEVSTSTPEELRVYISGEIKKYRDIIQRAGIKAN